MQDAKPLELLEELCSIDSRTIKGSEGATRVAGILGEQFRQLGFELEWFDTAPDGGRGRHLRAVRNPESAKRLILMGHVDTILAPSEVPFRVDKEAGRVYGSGVCDMKGGCVILLDAVRRALESVAAVDNAGLTVLLNSAEEFCEPVFRKLARESADGALACLNFEPAPPAEDGGHHIIISRKCVVRFYLRCIGRAAHAGNDHPAGINAIRELARKIEQIEDITDYSIDLTANVGHISGGKVSNQVADEASAQFELRAFDPDVLSAGFEALNGICSEPTVQSPVDGATTSLTLNKETAYPPWPGSPETDALARRYIEFARKQGIDVVPVKRGGGADISHVADLAPSLDGLGMLGGKMHTTDEWGDISTLPARTQIAADMIADICVGSE